VGFVRAKEVVWSDLLAAAYLIYGQFFGNCCKYGVGIASPDVSVVLDNGASVVPGRLTVVVASFMPLALVKRRDKVEMEGMLPNCVFCFTGLFVYLSHVKNVARRS
jgi:hypothetical protein